MRHRLFIILSVFSSILFVIAIVGVLWMRSMVTNVNEQPLSNVQTQQIIEEDATEQLSEYQPRFEQMELVNTSLWNDVEIEIFSAIINNPTTGDKQSVGILLPKTEKDNPLLIMVSGGSGEGLDFLNPERQGQASPAELFAQEGLAVIVFDALGVGQSEGVQNFYGHNDQDGMAAIIRAGKKLDSVDESIIGFASFSYGVTGATGVLARYSELGVSFFSDWEGPSSRLYTTIGCTSSEKDRDLHSPANHSCSDDAYWLEREASQLMLSVSGLKYYWRIQENEDHVQSTYGHSVEMLDSANEINIPWFRVNDGEINKVYSQESMPDVPNENHYRMYAIPHVLEMIERLKNDYE